MISLINLVVRLNANQLAGVSNLQPPQHSACTIYFSWCTGRFTWNGEASLDLKNIHRATKIIPQFLNKHLIMPASINYKMPRVLELRHGPLLVIPHMILASRDKRA